MSATYSLSSNVLTLRDTPERIDYHIHTGDYFAVVATMLGFLEESLGKCQSDENIEKERALAQELRRDLRYVQANYKIEARELVEVQNLRPRGNLLGK